MQTAKLNGREYKIKEVLPFDESLKALNADLVARGYETQTYVLVGKRGGQVVALRSKATGEFSKLY
jgi:hypothetical protein